MFTEQMAQGLGIVDELSPQSQGAGTYNSTGVQCNKGTRYMYVIEVGTVSAGGTLTAQLQSASDSVFTSPNNLPGASATISASNRRAKIEVRGDQIIGNQSANSLAAQQYLRVQVTIATNTVVFCAVGLLGEASQKPASSFDLANTTIAECSV